MPSSWCLLDPDMAHDAALLTRWAMVTPEVARIWFFGSRVRGTHEPDSDLDVAVEQDGSEYSGVNQEAWRELLSPLTRLPLDLWTYRPGADTRLDGAIAANGLLIYERK